MPSGEDRILDILGEFFPNAHPSMVMARGDDCALLRVPACPARGQRDEQLDRRPAEAPAPPDGLLALTSDIFAENSHFRRRYFSPRQIGHKALAVNLSDLAAAGARPTGFSLNLTLTGAENDAWLREFFQGMADLAKRFDAGLSGGDLSRGESLHIAITAWGDYAHGGLPLLRRGALPRSAGGPDFAGSESRAGDILFLLGDIGLARAGLLGLEEARSPAELAAFAKAFPTCRAAHLTPLPLVQEGLLLSRLAASCPTDFARLCLMDVSDGLARDLPRLLGREGVGAAENPPGSRFGAELLLPENALHPEMLAFARSKNLDPAEFAFLGGEDYALLGSCSPALWERLRQTPALPLRRLGFIRQGDILLNGEKTGAEGFDHFSA